MTNSLHFNYCFTAEWLSASTKTCQWKYSGLNVVQKIKPTDRVIDIGCGNNWIKPHVPNLIGIDVVNDAADIKINVLDYYPEHKFNVAIIFGAFNYGEEYIIQNLEHIMLNILTGSATIYWRTMLPPWSFQKHEELSKKFGFRLQFITNDEHPSSSRFTVAFGEPRIYAEWVK